MIHPLARRTMSTRSRRREKTSDRELPLDCEQQVRRTHSLLTVIARAFFIRRRGSRCHCFDVHNPRFIKHRPALSSPTTLCSPRVCSSLLIIPLPSGLFSRHAVPYHPPFLMSRMRVRTYAWWTHIKSKAQIADSMVYSDALFSTRLNLVIDLLQETRNPMILDD